MSARSDYVSLEIGGVRVDDWLEYHVESDILTPADAFSMTLGVQGQSTRRSRELDRLRELCTPLTRVQLFVGAPSTGGQRGGSLIFTGLIDTREIVTSRDAGTTLTIEGRDAAAYLVDSTAPHGLVRELGAEVTFATLARAAVAPWGIEVVSEASTMREIATGLSQTRPEQRLRAERAQREGLSPRTISPSIVQSAQRRGVPLDESVGRTASARGRARSANGMTGSDVERLTVDEASPQDGETVWTFLARHAERLGVLMFMDPRGRLVIGAPDYTSAPLYRFVCRSTSSPTDPNNVTSIGVRSTGAERFSRVKVFGRAHGRGVARSRIRAIIEDPDMPFVRERTENDRNVRTEGHAQRIAKRLMREGIAGAEVITVHADDHGQGRYLYTPNVTAHVVDDANDIDGRRYITSRSFSRSRDGGTTTQLRLVQLDSLTL